MKLTVDIFTAFCSLITLVGCKETFLYEKKHFFGLGRRVIPNPKAVMLNLNFRAAHPEPIPTPVPKPNLVSTSKNLYQGKRLQNDTRVFRRRFDYTPNEKGQQVMCDGYFNCIITFLAVESTEAIPVILRGGAGYRHFSAIVKAKPGFELKGQVRAYCKQPQERKFRPAMRSWKRYKFGELESSNF
ncbi:uncharacterized protein LOC142973308 [Anticarsia gemmatalis]|uniref:uncharacterized protein LOC142973308 n=1 Tax=Anticarsia gemmatalis TaxID=129554 RepID=UPI003F776614